MMCDDIDESKGLGAMHAQGATQMVTTKHTTPSSTSAERPAVSNSHGELCTNEPSLQLRLDFTP